MDEIWCSVANSWIKFAGGGISQAFTNSRNKQGFKNIPKKIVFIVIVKGRCELFASKQCTEGLRNI